MRRLIALLLLWASLSTAQAGDAAPVLYALGLDGDGIANVLRLPEGTPITFAAVDVYYYDVTADGRALVYAERAERGGPSDLVWVELATGITRTLIACRAQDIDCRRPAFSPDGRWLAYERHAPDPDNPATLLPPEIWRYEWTSGAREFIAPGVQPAWVNHDALAFVDLSDAPRLGLWQAGALRGFDLPGAFPWALRMDGAELVLIVPGADLQRYSLPEMGAVDLPQQWRAEAGTQAMRFAWQPNQHSAAIARSSVRTNETRLLWLGEEDTRLLWQGAGSITGLAWDSSGQQLAFEHLPPGAQRPELWSVGLDGQAAQRVAEMSWSPRWAAAPEESQQG